MSKQTVCQQCKSLIKYESKDVKKRITEYATGNIQNYVICKCGNNAELHVSLRKMIEL
ncbi:hypothetical protein KLEP7_gp41 [Pseudaeromonas phage vB_PpeM_ KLEP7]|nr:hypothetical protein KLEP7_gp41 [Pseudaeromonas phage vB_PpeM_ KLEP7]